jgi:O-antigen/teichoic acid export membrane protein
VSTRRSGSGRSDAVAAVIAPFSQALGSFVLHFLAQHFLGVSGLGRFALVYGLVAIATAVTTGLVGDSLTVLDRSRPEIRAGIQTWLLIIAPICSLLLVLFATLSGTVALAPAAVGGGACVLFVVEDTVRRTLMASFQFWSVAVTDIVGMCVSVSAVLLTATFGDVTLSWLLIALGAGQAIATVVGIGLLRESSGAMDSGEPPSR